MRPRYWSLRNSALFEDDPIWIAQVPREWQSADQVAAMVVLNARWAGDDLARGGSADVADRRSPPTDPVARVAWVRACLESAGCFTLLDELPQPATDTEIARAEARLGRTLPEGLRALYRVGVSLYWDVRDDGPSALVEVDVAGQLELIPIDDLAIEDHRIRFTNDGCGNGFCLGVSADGADPVMYWNHDEDEVVPFTHVFPAAGRRSARAQSFDAFFAAWARLGFSIDHERDGDLELVVKLLETGKLPKPRTAKAVSRSARGSALPKPLRELPGDIMMYAVVPLDGALVLAAGYHGTLRVIDVAAATTVHEAPVGGMIYAAARSPCSQWVVSAGETGVRWASLPELTVVAGPSTGTAAWSVAFTADGDVVEGRPDGTLVRRRRDGQVVWRVQAHVHAVVSIERSADGALVSYAYGEAGARIAVHSADGVERARIEGPFLRPGAGVALSLNRRSVLVVVAPRRVVDIPLEAPRAPALVADTTGEVWSRLLPLDATHVLAGTHNAAGDTVLERWDTARAVADATLIVPDGGVPSAMAALPGRGSALVSGYHGGWLGEWRLPALSPKAKGS